MGGERDHGRLCDGALKYLAACHDYGKGMSVTRKFPPLAAESQGRESLGKPANWAHYATIQPSWASVLLTARCPGIHQLRTRQMIEYLKKHASSVFDATANRILVDAFDEAWKSVQDSGAANATNEARDVLAKHIVNAAMDGERDHGRLCDGALKYLAKVSRAAAVPTIWAWHVNS